MTNPMNWTLPLFRAFGVQVKVHILYFVIAASLFLRAVFPPQGYVPIQWVDALFFVVVLPFVIILLHEFGHVFGGRSVGGESDEILMWPLGGLAFVDTPRDWKSHTITIAAGPLVNLIICFITSVALAAGGYLPTLNPAASPYVSPVYNYRDHRTYTSDYGNKYYAPETDTPMAAGEPGAERALAPTWAVWVNRAFWLSWVLFLFNLIPAYPLDGGQLLQGFVWWRTDYRQGVQVACTAGYICGVLMLIAAFVFNESMCVGLSLFMLFESWRRLHQLNTDGGEFGYDFSGGYSTLDPDEQPAKKAKKPGLLKRWLQARAAKRLQKEHEQRHADDERMDQLLEKIARKEPLSDEEKRFMQRVSARYRKQ